MLCDALIPSPLFHTDHMFEFYLHEPKDYIHYKYFQPVWTNRSCTWAMCFLMVQFSVDLKSHWSHVKVLPECTLKKKLLKKAKYNPRTKDTFTNINCKKYLISMESEIFVWFSTQHTDLRSIRCVANAHVSC